MAKLEHLPLPRVEGELVRRKKPGFGQPLDRDVPSHATLLETQITAIEAARPPKAAGAIDVPLLLQIKSKGPVEASNWPRVDMQVLSTDPGNTIVLFAADAQLTKFKSRLAEYRQQPPAGQKGQKYAGFIEPIEEIEERKPTDRVGAALKTKGITQPSDFVDDEQYTLDIEMYRPTDEYVGVFYARVENIVTTGDGQVLSQYRGASLLLMRIRGNGRLVKRLLSAAEILEIDLPPEPDLDPVNLFQVDVGEGITITAAPSDAAAIGVVDSGLTTAHPLLAGSVIGAFGVPPALGASDEWGHGTPVAGVASLGDLRPMVTAKAFSARFRLASARVLTDQGRFHDTELISSQMDQAIRKLHDEFGCTVINISLCDPSRMAGSKPSAWAATLDELARELDIVIVVSAGNRNDLLSGRTDGPEDVVDRYPHYLFEQENRLYEPGTAANVITVGSVSASNGRKADDDVAIRFITEADQPSPFSRIGPGVADIVKPDFVDYGGTCLFNGGTQNLIKGDHRSEAGIICTNSKYLEGLLISRSGTSYSAPLIAHKAAAIRDELPHASANLVRALLVLGSEVPPTAKLRMADYDFDEQVKVVGNGIPDLERSLYSDDNRVILYDEAEVTADHFLVYEIPVPTEFQSTSGLRRIDVALAFDPPTRRTRADYIGHTMSFDIFRGLSLADVYDACRKWLANEGEPLRVAGKYRAKLEPSITRRGSSTLQRATYTASTNIAKYGSAWHLVVRCESGWAPTIKQRFAVAVQMSHEANIPLHARLQERIRVRV